jgi:hypothetical protein
MIYGKTTIRKKEKLPLEVDLDLQTVAEILNKERFISCHSYVQSNIDANERCRNSISRLTFTHILEGYKVADKMKNMVWARPLCRLVGL